MVEIVLLSIFVPIIYLFVLGTWYSYLMKVWGENCSHSYCDHGMGAGLLAIIWPLSFVILGGVYSGRNIKTPSEREQERVKLENENSRRLRALEEENNRLDHLIKSSDWYEGEMAKLPPVKTKAKR